eukprot:8644597-Pyramimonas_sp.AAC.1
MAIRKKFLRRQSSLAKRQAAAAAAAASAAVSSEVELAGPMLDSDAGPVQIGGAPGPRDERSVFPCQLRDGE